MPGATLVKKLKVKGGHPMAILNPPDVSGTKLGKLPEGAAISDSVEGTYDINIHGAGLLRRGFSSVAPISIDAVRSAMRFKKIA